MSASKNLQSGFSLIEMMVAIMILAVGLLGLAQLQITAIQGNSKVGSLMAANAVAQTALEEVMSIPVNPEASAVAPNVAFSSDPLYPIYTNILQPISPVTTATDWPVNPVRDVPGNGSYKITFTTEKIDVGSSSSEMTKVNIIVDSLGIVGFGSTRSTSVAFRFFN